MKHDMAYGSAEVTLITAEGGRTWLNLRELYRYRELLFVLTARDVKVRYKQTALGVMWALLQPLANMLLFTLVFGRLAKLPSDGFPYPIFAQHDLTASNWGVNSTTSNPALIASSITRAASICVPWGEIICSVTTTRRCIYRQTSSWKKDSARLSHLRDKPQT